MPNNAAVPIDGVLTFDKPARLTSHDVVAHVRRLTHLSRVGHAGTLDPAATGVLLLGLGRGTKLTPFLQEYPKTYRATLRLGVRTDTYDACGRVVEVRPVPPLTKTHVEAVLAGFQGSITQVPPMYSALKQRGQRLYRLARQGLEVERQPRRVHIYRLSLLALQAETLALEVECSAGTYIRVLADDIGRRLGCGAHVTSIVRTAIGPFALPQALTLPAFEAAVRQGTWRRSLVSLAHAVAAFPALRVTAAAVPAIAHGKAPTPRDVGRVIGAFAAGATVALTAPDGGLLAMASASIGSAALAKAPAEAPIVQLRRVLV